MYSGGDDVNDRITFRRLHSNVKLSPEYKSILSPPPVPLYGSLLPNPLPPSGRLIISAFGGKHYMGSGWHGIKRIKAGPSFWLGLSRSTFITNRALKEGASPSSLREKPKIWQETKKNVLKTCCCFFFFSFLSVNQRCYLTQVPYVISITFWWYQR